MKRKHSTKNEVQRMKELAAKSRKDFFARMKFLVDGIGGKNTFDLFSPSDLDEIYGMRFRSLKIINANGHETPKAILKEMQMLATEVLKRGSVPINCNTPFSISLFDFSTVGLTLLLYLHNKKEEVNSRTSNLLSALDYFISFEDNDAYRKASEELHHAVHYLSVMYSETITEFFGLEFVTLAEVKGVPGMYLCGLVSRFKNEPIQVTIDEKSRPVFPVTSSIYNGVVKLDLVTVKVSNIDARFTSNTELPVYIQNHALNRLSERLDGAPMCFLLLCLHSSMKNPEIFKNNKGELLTPYYLGKVKVGYLKLLVVDGLLVIQTFLFLTNNSTPEGIKLNANTGFLKEDKMYLSIDKLSTFLKTDMQSNEVVKKMFIDAGCGSLFTIDLKSFAQFNRVEMLKSAEYIEKYLNTGK